MRLGGVFDLISCNPWLVKHGDDPIGDVKHEELFLKLQAGGDGPQSALVEVRCVYAALPAAISPRKRLY